MRCPKRYGSLTGHVLSDQVGNGGLSRADMEAQYTLYYLPVRCRPTGVLAQEFGTHRGRLARSGRSVSPVCCPESVDAVSLSLARETIGSTSFIGSLLSSFHDGLVCASLG